MHLAAVTVSGLGRLGALHAAVAPPGEGHVPMAKLEEGIGGGEAVMRGRREEELTEASGRAAGEKGKETTRKGGAKAAGGGEDDEDASVYDAQTEGVDISGADIALSEFFSSPGAQSVTLETPGAETQSTGERATGSARALPAAGRERPPPQDSDESSDELSDELADEADRDD